MPSRASFAAGARARRAVALAVAASLAACGRPAPPDMRSEMASAMAQLPVRPVYPLTETLRLGTVLIADTSIALPFVNLPPFQETSLVLTDDFVAAFDNAWRSRVPVASRQLQSPSDLGSALRPAQGSAGFYRQLPPAGTGNTVAPDNALPLAALPALTLASVDQLSVGLFLPDLVATFFGALGLRRTSYLRLEPEGIEIADLPIVDWQAALETACLSPAVRQRTAAYQRAVAQARSTFEAQRRLRIAMRRGPTTPPTLSLVLARRVFYLRGIRFVLEDTSAAQLLAQAAIANPLPEGRSAVSLPPVTITNLAPTISGTPQPGSPTAADAAAAARIQALEQQVQQLRAALAQGDNTQIGLRAARATATGIELVQLFDRPLAFGYQAVFTTVDWTDPERAKDAHPDDVLANSGLAPLCRTVGVRL
jgi:hypothetical protein